MKLNGDMLKDAREKKAQTQDEVANALHMSRATISAAENGDDVAISSAKKLCEYLEVDIAKAHKPRVAEGDGDAA